MSTIGPEGGWAGLEMMFTFFISIPVIVAFIALYSQRPKFYDVINKQIIYSAIFFLVFHVLLQISLARKVEIKLVDNLDNPIERAIFLSEKSKSLLLYPYLRTRKKVSTNANGLYSTWLFPNQLLYLSDFKKRGYEFWGGEYPDTNFDYKDEISIFKQIAPREYRVKKLPPPGFVNKRIIDKSFKENGGSYKIDIKEGLVENFPVNSRYYKRYKHWREDIGVFVDPLPGGNGFEISLHTPHEGDGIQQQESDDNIAPNEGYHPNLRFEVKTGGGKINKTIYFKGRQPVLHARIQFSAKTKKQSYESNRIEGFIYTNQEGSRNTVFEKLFTYERKIEILDREIAKNPTEKPYRERAQIKLYLGDRLGAAEDRNNAADLRQAKKDYYEKQRRQTLESYKASKERRELNGKGRKSVGN